MFVPNIAVVNPLQYYMHRYKAGPVVIYGPLLAIQYPPKNCNPCYVMLGSSGDKIFVFSARKSNAFSKPNGAKPIHEWWICSQNPYCPDGYLYRPFYERDLCISNTRRHVKYSQLQNLLLRLPWLRNLINSRIIQWNRFGNIHQGGASYKNALALIIPPNSNLILKFAIEAHHFP